MIYLDNAATTRLLDKALDEMIPYFGDNYFNPNAAYSEGLFLRNKIEECRKVIADSINALPEEIYFTSGGTESDNWAIKGICKNSVGKHIVSTNIEHHAVLNTLKQMEKEGYDVTYLEADSEGKISLEQLENALRPDTVLVSIMYANNEIGTIQDIDAIGKLLAEKNIPFHTDAVQAYGHVKINVRTSNIQLLSASAHKFHGPKGIGFLYCKKEQDIQGLLQGGVQENKLRPGTLNVPGIIGMTKAAEYMHDNMQEFSEHDMKLRNYMKTLLSEKIDNICFYGSFDSRLSGNLSVGFDKVDSERMIALLNHDGVICSNGAACLDTGVEISHVLKAIGLTDDKAKNVIRISISDETTQSDIEKAVECMAARVRLLRMMQ